jgi:hypothetical protein
MNKINTLRHSPWGTVEYQKVLKTVNGHDIIFVSTPSHGGAYVPNELLGFIPFKEQQEAARWSRSVNWYEEDCCIMSVIKAFNIPTEV